MRLFHHQQVESTTEHKVGSVARFLRFFPSHRSKDLPTSGVEISSFHRARAREPTEPNNMFSAQEGPQGRCIIWQRGGGGQSLNERHILD